MDRITSFCVDHDILLPGMYVSKIDRDITTFDVRMVKPNGGEYLDMASVHTFEHLFATYVRNSKFKENIVYVGPMGCRTGFYFLTRDMKNIDALNLMTQTAKFISEFNEEIPGATRKECGNYLEHNLTGANLLGQKLYNTLKDLNESDMMYK